MKASEHAPGSASARHAALAARIETLALDPAEIDGQALFRLARPLLSVAGWRARVRYRALDELVRLLAWASRPEVSAEESAKALGPALDAALRELEDNLATLERAAIVRRRPPVAHAAWARRVWEVLATAQGAVARLEGGAPDVRSDLRRLAHRDRTAIVPPLAVTPPRKRKDSGDDARADASAFFAEVATSDAPPVPETDARVVELELATVDHLLAAASAETSFLGRRRRLLVAARQRLLEAAAALPLDEAGVKARIDHVAREIARIDRLETLGLRADVALLHQARTAIDRGDPRTLWATLAAVDDAALAGGDAEVARVTSRTAPLLWGGQDPASEATRRASLRRSAEELLGKDTVAAVTTGLDRARKAALDAEKSGATAEARQTAAILSRRAYAAEAEEELLSAAVAVDGCFEVGGALAPVRIWEEERVPRVVRHPTQDLVLVPATDPADLPDAILGDPRTVLLDLATGRLLARRFVRHEAVPRPRVVMQSEVRVYVLDGSTSMAGARGRVRDALLVAELATVMARIASPGQLRATLYHRYFDEVLHPVTRVDTVAAARAAIADVLATPRSGGTNIQAALEASLEQIAVARDLDPELARAQIVLVTDGEADVSEEAIVTARAALGDLPVGISVIALGQENAALRGIVARQRAAGQAAFYHFLDDAQLETIAKGDFDHGLALHLPEGPKRPAQVVARDLAEVVGPLVDELLSIERARDAASLEALDADVQARRELGVEDAGGTPGDGRRARLEAHHKDRVALGARYARWFPEPKRVPGETAAPAIPRGGGEDVEAVACALASVAEVLALLGGSELARRADAIELVERLLPEARLTPARWHATLRDHAAALAPALEAVHAAVRGKD